MGVKANEEPGVKLTQNHRLHTGHSRPTAGSAQAFQQPMQCGNLVRSTSSVPRKQHEWLL